MGVPHVTSFCCCMGIKTGAKVVACVHMMASLVLVILCSIFAENSRSFIGTVEDDGDHLYSTWYKIAIGVAIMSVVHVCLASVLLYSLLKSSTAGIRAWVYVMLALFAVSIIYVIVNLAIHGVSESTNNIFVSFLEAVVFFGVVGYSILTVYSYYLMLKSEEDMAGPDKADYN